MLVIAFNAVRDIIVSVFGCEPSQDKEKREALHSQLDVANLEVSHRTNDVEIAKQRLEEFDEAFRQST